MDRNVDRVFCQKIKAFTKLKALVTIIAFPSVSWQPDYMINTVVSAKHEGTVIVSFPAKKNWQIKPEFTRAK